MHDSPQGRWVNGFGSCGQNIFIATQKVPWLVTDFDNKYFELYLF